MPDLDEFRRAVTLRSLQSLDDVAVLAESTAQRDALHHMLAPARSLLQGGKKTRALLLLAGYLCGADHRLDPPIRAGSALELYQVSALIHDDVIDDSPTRRGMPAAHIAFGNQLVADGCSGASLYGVAGAITLGDLLLSHSIAELAGALTARSDARTLESFVAMTSEVAYGQFLDIRAEYYGASLADALGIVRHKSARYSVELPLVIGAQLAGAPLTVEQALKELGLPLGEAFQLRDDDLGIFGDPSVTGKPSCGDITEGKNTVLLALTRQAAPQSDTAWLESLKGKSLSFQDAERVRSIVTLCGARERHEALIRDREQRAAAVWESLPLCEGRSILHDVMQQLRHRTA